MEGESRKSSPAFCLHLQPPRHCCRTQGGPRTEKEAMLQCNPLNFIDGETETQRREGPAAGCTVNGGQSQMRNHCGPGLVAFRNTELEFHPLLSLPPPRYCLPGISLRIFLTLRNKFQCIIFSVHVSGMGWGGELQEIAALMGEGGSCHCC